MGTISSLQVYNYVLSPEQVKVLSTQSPPIASASELMPGGERRTEDGRVCLTPCSPDEPFQEEQHSWPSLTNPSIALACTDDGWLPAFNGFSGSHFLVTCPEDCHKSKAPLKGTNVYTPDSSICKAALHVGVLDVHGGNAVVVLHNGISTYVSSEGKHGALRESAPPPKPGDDNHVQVCLAMLTQNPRCDRFPSFTPRPSKN